MAGTRQAARIAHDEVSAGKDDRLAVHGHREARGLGQATPAGARVDGEQRGPGGPLHELHGGGVARVHLDRQRHAVPRDEVESVESPEAERFRHRVRQRRRTDQQLRLAREERRPLGREQAATVPEAMRAEAALAHELPRETERDGAPAVRREDDRSGEAADPLLHVGPARDRPPDASTAWSRGRHPSAAASAASVPARASAGGALARVAGTAKPRCRSTRVRVMGFRTRERTAGGLPSSRRPRASAATASG